MLLVDSAAERAAEDAATAWRADAAGAELLRESGERAGPLLPRLPGRRRARPCGTGRPACSTWCAGRAAPAAATARAAAYGVNATGLLVMIAIFATTNVLAAPLEVAVAGGIPVLSQKVLEAVFGDQAVRRLAATARADLLERVAKLLDDERERYDDAAGHPGPRPGGGGTAGARGGRGGAGAMRLDEMHPLMYRRRRRAEQQAERRPSAAIGVDVAERLAALDEVIDRRRRAGCPTSSWPPPGSWPAGPASGCGCPARTPWWPWPGPPGAASPRCSTRWPGSPVSAVGVRRPTTGRRTR